MKLASSGWRELPHFNTIYDEKQKRRLSRVFVTHMECRKFESTCMTRHSQKVGIGSDCSFDDKLLAFSSENRGSFKYDLKSEVTCHVKRWHKNSHSP
jgi:hypothetical protein